MLKFENLKKFRNSVTGPPMSNQNISEVSAASSASRSAIATTTAKCSTIDSRPRRANDSVTYNFSRSNILIYFFNLRLERAKKHWLERANNRTQNTLLSVFRKKALLALSIPSRKIINNLIKISIID